MNRAATQDLRAVRVWPAIGAVLATGPAPTPRAQASADLVTAWSAAGGSRLDRDLDGRVDDPGAGVLDAAWPRLAGAALGHVLGPLAPETAVAGTDMTGDCPLSCRRRTCPVGRRRAVS
jgi:hypothetical protein